MDMLAIGLFLALVNQKSGGLLVSANPPAIPKFEHVVAALRSRRYRLCHCLAFWRESF